MPATELESDIEEIKAFQNEIKLLSDDLKSNIQSIKSRLQKNSEKQDELLSRHQEISEISSLNEIKENLKRMLDEAYFNYKHRKESTLLVLASSREKTDKQLSALYSQLARNAQGNADPDLFIFMLKPFILNNLDSIAKEIAPSKTISFEEKTKMLSDIDNELKILNDEEKSITDSLSADGLLNITYEYTEQPNALLENVSKGKQESSPSVSSQPYKNDFKVSINGE